MNPEITGHRPGDADQARATDLGRFDPREIGIDEVIGAQSPATAVPKPEVTELTIPAAVESIRSKVFSLYKKPALFEKPTIGLEANPELTVSISASSAELIQLQTLFANTDSSRTMVGRNTYLRSLHAPVRDELLVRGRQQAVQAIEEDSSLREKIKNLVSTWSKAEEEVLKFAGYMYSMHSYAEHYEQVAKTFREIVKQAEELKPSAPPYVQALLQEIKEFSESRIYQMFGRDLVALPQHKVGLSSEANWFQKIRGSYTRGPVDYIDGERIAVAGVITYAACKMIITGLLSKSPEPPSAEALSVLLRTTWGMTYGLMIAMGNQIGIIFDKRQRDESRFFFPLGEELKKDAGFDRLLDTIGYLDELLVLANLKEKLPNGGSRPTINFESEHYFHARNLHNPCLAINPDLLKEGEESIPNDISLDGSAIVAVGGPNSAGKSTIADTIAQTEILALLGGRVMGEVILSAPDRIVFQSHEKSPLIQKKGRMAAESAETRTTLESLTPRSLWIVDELLQGTTDTESRNAAGRVLDTGQQLGATVLVITHDAALLDKLNARVPERSILHPLRYQVEDGRTTHVLVPGISREAHAAEVLEEEKLTARHLEQLLRDRGRLRRGLDYWENL